MAIFAIVPEEMDLNTYEGEYVSVKVGADGTVRTNLCIGENDGNARVVARMELYSVCDAMKCAADLGVPIEICEG